MIVSAADLGQLLQQDWHRFCHLPQQFLRFFVALLWELRWAAQYAGFSSETYLPAYAVDVGMLLQGLGPNDGLYGWKRFLRPSARWLGLGSRCDLPALLCATSWTCVMMRWIQCTRFSRVLWTLPRMPLLPLLRTDVAGEPRWSHSPSKTHEKKKKAIDKKLQQGTVHPRMLCQGRICRWPLATCPGIRCMQCTRKMALPKCRQRSG
mmetsp:Transcript_98876/g.235801  ORF Transcript_98876/g.235801 Transcript_98876/m.235801 type:complete len:207 (-) Transcript_98876:2548-3168(-)